MAERSPRAIAPSNGWAKAGGIVTTVGTTVVTMIATMGVPWAYSIHGRITNIEASFSDIRKRLDVVETPPGWFLRDVQENTAAIKALTKAMQENRDALRDLQRANRINPQP